MYLPKGKNTNNCECGSDQLKYPLFDGYNIFLTYACAQCEDTKLMEFRPDIMKSYETDEVIEPIE